VTRHILAFILAAAPLLAQTPAAKPSALPAADIILKFHDTRLAAVKSWQANFIKNISEGAITIVQSGSVRFVRQPATASGQPAVEKGRADFMMQVKGRDLGQTIVFGADNIAWQIVSQGSLRGIYKLDMNRPIAGSKEDPRGLNPINEVNPLALLQKFRARLAFVTEGVQELGGRRLCRLVGKPKTAPIPGDVQIGALQAWFGFDDGFLHRIVINDLQGNPALAIDLSSVRLNLPLDDALFVFAPPPNANIQDLNARLGSALK
jgi:outer membrane lipoprotein-sorting protein